MASKLLTVARWSAQDGFRSVYGLSISNNLSLQKAPQLLFTTSNHRMYKLADLFCIWLGQNEQLSLLEKVVC